MRKILTAGVALLATLTAVGMAMVSANDRGADATDKVLLMALALVVVLGAHFLPALAKSKITWIVWAGCIFAAIYGHLVFFSGVQERMGRERAEVSPLVADIQQRITSVTAMSNAISARSTTELYTLLADTHRYYERIALHSELEQANRKLSLDNQVLKLQEELQKAHVTESTDAVTALLSGVTGGNGRVISVSLGLIFALLTEFLGAVLWREVLHHHKKHNLVGEVVEMVQTRKVIEQVVERISAAANDPAPADPVELLKNEVRGGRLKPTVSAIRARLNCSTAKASELRRHLLQYK